MYDYFCRDTAITEIMDYASAFLTVLTSLLVCVLRMIGPSHSMAGVVTAMFAAFYSHHVYTLAFVKFDYGYNMKVNVVVGVLNGLLWLVWSYLHSGDGTHIRKGVIAILSLSFSVLLELLDFPPWLWILDSHALWHLATVPVPLLWYRFAAGDCLMLEKRQSEKKKL